MEDKEYKVYHEKYMTGNTGTSTLECFILLTSLVLNLFISLLLFSHNLKIPKPYFEFFTIILPMVFNSTLLSGINHLIFLNIILLFLILLSTKVDKNKFKVFLNFEVPKRKTFITNYRAGTNLFSTFCILAVDFTIFPKRLSKTESFGFGFMDLGVGFFVCSNGLVEKHCKTNDQFTKLLKSVSVLFFLGATRLLSVKSIDYHEHVSEYGVHWNFFFTLAACRVISYIIMTNTNYANPLWLALGTGVAHQTLLYIGLENWVMSNTPRNNFFTANKEGVTSSLGYVCLFFASSSLGKCILSNITYKRLIIKLIIISIIIWIFYHFSINIFGCSRRLVNLGYIFWVLALTVSELLLFIVGELCIFCTKAKFIENKNSVPVLFDSINSNGLFFFLFGNLLTGLVNNIFQTLLLGKVASFSIITCYMIVLCSLTYFLNVKKIHLKL